ncbi:alpha-glucosidase [Nocardioides sp. NPDC057772]|uniref:alpha-glucosidase n=1 Tax=Nocardioides sp. NPDC057772 TaxID=3346245 RepID=UPI0036709826
MTVIEPSGRTGPGWWRSAVVYQVYPRSFADGNGDGVGDLRGIRERLDHLEWLGVDVLWISPVYPSPMADNGYDVSDYLDVDPAYGTLAELDALIAELHERGMKLVMDLVANHTSDEHPWFVDSSSSPESAKRDWYWWRDEPNNWGSFFSGPAWTYSEGRAAYYLHLFTRKQPDLNWENPEVRHAVYDIMRWWLDRGIDGFRMDVVNLISKDPDLPEAPVMPGQRYGNMRASVLDGPRVHEFLAEMHREVFDRYEDRDLLLVGETGETTVEEGRKYTDPARRELDMVLHYEHVEIDHGTFKWDVRPFDLGRLRERLAAWQTGLADVGWNSLYWDNHDQPRVVSRYGDDDRWRTESAKLLATVLHLQRGTPFVYQGDEIGMTNYPFASIDEFDDVEAVNYYHEAIALGVEPEDVMRSLRAMSRDNGRTPMQWDDSPNAGFTTGTPWLAVNPNHTEINVAAQRDDPDSVLSHYRRLIQLRHEDPAVVDGDFTLLTDSHPQVFAFRRRHESGQLAVLANFSGAEADLGELAEECRGDLVIGSGHGPVMAPWESRVYRR